MARPAAPPTSFDRLFASPRARQIGMAGLSMVGLMLAQAWSLRGVDPNDLPGEPPAPSGPLARYVVQTQRDPLPSCRAEACTLAMVRPLAVEAALSASAVSAVRLPTESVEASRVWVMVDDVAVPVQVSVLGGDSATLVVTERAGMRRYPIDATDWRALDSHGRAKVHRATATAPALLTPASTVIRRPAPGLKPGARIRIETLESVDAAPR